MELFTKFDGRVSRRGFWLGFLGMVAISLVAGSVLISVVPGGIALSLAQIILSVGVAYIWAAVLVKRLHDRNKPALPWLAIFLAPGVLYQIMSVFKIGFTTVEFAGTPIMVPGPAAMVVTWVSLAVGLWMVIEMGFLKGTAGDNSYGPDPLAGPQAAQEA